MIRTIVALGLLFAWPSAARADDLIRREWNVDGTAREALVYAPAAAKTQASPLVFAFHGHGGTMKFAAEKFAYHKHWPQAIVVYMQGLKTPSRLVDPEGKHSGWQTSPGDQNDRDLKFFDAALASLKKDYRVDAKRIYCTGHSNGGAFTYQLWAVRGDVFAAIAPCAAPARPAFFKDFRPKPVFHMAGENDPIVKFEWQKMTIDAVKRLNGCGDGTKWAPQCTLYPSKSGSPLVTYIHSGGHQFPADVPALIVRFFKEHAKP
jgi:polyhydroxybutyrate depolymerase